MRQSLLPTPLTSRRDFLRLGAGGLAVAALGSACGSDDSDAAADLAGGTSRAQRPVLRIAQWSHFVPEYDQWFDGEYVKRWGDEHDVDVIVDHIPLNELPVRADAETAAQRGHDIFWFLTPRPTLEDAVIDHTELVDEVTARFGRLVPHVERSVRNAKTSRYFAFPDNWSAGPIHYRRDLWRKVGEARGPRTWEDVLRAAPALKALGHPLGLGYSSDLDSDWTVGSILHSFGASLQDEGAQVTINSSAAVEAVEFGAKLFKAGMTDEIFNWDASSNNRLLVTGRGSLILNAISAIRAAELEDPELAADIALAPVPTAAAGDVPRGEYGVGSYVIWRFAKQPELAKQFLIDLAFAQREAFLRSKLYNLPVFSRAVPDLAKLVAKDSEARPDNKYALLGNAASWSTNVGYPGSHNAAVDEVFSRYLVPQMFASAAKGEKSPKQAVADAEAQIKPIFARWRKLGKV